ncbi:unnamed protein product [Macrosiphum euphorbiae]|uniref:Uncharacterized protein n=1 Tax=Macrosiphum euphorbiae TaxID=13131 RepID=A0AAV0WQM4_9HEMI|nr:unnamed protein product [Macrosiphum euphorbiae]
MAAHRLQRYAVFLAGYTFTIEFVEGGNNGNADALSRLPLEGGIADLDICEKIQRDKVLKKVFLFLKSGKLPNSSNEVKRILSRILI